MPRQKLTGVEKQTHDALLLLQSEGVIECAGRPEPEILHLATECDYTPDFIPLVRGVMKIVIEVKGPYTHEDSRIKFKFATMADARFFVWAKQFRPNKDTGRIRWRFEVWRFARRIDQKRHDSALEGLRWALEKIERNDG